MAVDFVSRPPYNVVQPGSYSAVDVSELTSPSDLSGQPITAILGTACGGQPNTPLYFSSPGVLLSVLRSGVAYDCGRFNLGAGAPQVCFVRVGKEITQGELKLAASTGIAATLTSLDWGSWVNAITVAVEAGPIINLAYTDELGNVYKETWNLAGVGGGTPSNAQVAEAINGQLYGMTGSNFVSAAAGAGSGGIKTGVSATALTGGKDGLAPEASNWTSGLQALESEEVSIVVPASSEATVHAQVLEHCQVMSTPNTRKERTTVVGGASGETVAKQIERIENLPSSRAQLVYPGMKQYGSSGELVTWDPFYRAAMVAGMHCALPDVATSLTHARTSEIGVEVALSTVQGGPVDQLLLAGVTPFTPAPRGGVWCVDSLSGNKEPSGVFRDYHKTRSADYVARYLRGNLEARYVGGKSLNGTAGSMAIQAAILLKELLATQIIRAFKEPTVQAGPNNGPIVTPGNSYNLTAPVMLVDTDKFIFITVALQSPATIPTGA